MDIYFFNPTNISVGYILTKVRYRFAHLKYQWILTNSLYPERYKYTLSYTLANHIFLNILFTGWYLVLICIFTSILKYISSLNYLYIFFFSHFFLWVICFLFIFKAFSYLHNCYMCCKYFVSLSSFVHQKNISSLLHSLIFFHISVKCNARKACYPKVTQNIFLYFIFLMLF